MLPQGSMVYWMNDLEKSRKTRFLDSYTRTHYVYFHPANSQMWHHLMWAQKPSRC